MHTSLSAVGWPRLTLLLLAALDLLESDLRALTSARSSGGLDKSGK